MSVVNVVIVWYGGALNLKGTATIGDIMAFQWYTFLLLTPVWNIVNSFSELQRSLAAMERVFEVLALEDEKPDRPDARNAPSVVHELRFDNVEFEYREGIPEDSRGALPGYGWLAKRFADQATVDRAEKIRPIAEELGCTMAQLAIAWCAANPRVTTVITGAS